MELLPQSQPPGGPRELDSVSARSRELCCRELPGWGRLTPRCFCPAAQVGRRLWMPDRPLRRGEARRGEDRAGDPQRLSQPVQTLGV